MRTHAIIFAVLALAALAVFGHSPAYRQAGGKAGQQNLDEGGLSGEVRARSSYEMAYLFPPQSISSPAEAEEGAAETGARGFDNLTTSGAQGELPVFRRVSGEPAPEVRSVAGLVADLETGHTYWGRETRARWPLASITKLVTAAFAKNHLKLPDAVELTDRIFSRIGDAESGKFSVGERYSAESLIRAMLIFSSNESAEALAEAYTPPSPSPLKRGGGRDAFVNGMNALAAEWGAAATHFEDPTGLSVANQSTASDIALIARTVYEQYPDLLAVTRTPRMALVELGTNLQRFYENINAFADRPDFIGGKTGYTDEAEGNLVSLFAYEGRPVVIVVLGSEDRFGATENLLQWFKRTHTSR